MALLSNLLKQTLKHGGFKWFEFHINPVFDELTSYDSKSLVFLCPCVYNLLSHSLLARTYHRQMAIQPLHLIITTTCIKKHSSSRLISRPLPVSFSGPLPASFSGPLPVSFSGPLPASFPGHFWSHSQATPSLIPRFHLRRQNLEMVWTWLCAITCQTSLENKTIDLHYLGGVGLPQSCDLPVCILQLKSAASESASHEVPQKKASGTLFQESPW